MKFIVFMMAVFITSVHAATLREQVNDHAATLPLTNAVRIAWDRGFPTPMRDHLAQPVEWSTNTVQVITTNDVSAVAITQYLKAFAPAGLTPQSTAAEIRTAWRADVDAAGNDAKPGVLAEMAVWMPAWFTYQTTDELPAYETNTVQTVTVTQRRWQALGLTIQPNNNDLEGR